MASLDHFLQTHIEKRKQEGLFRALTTTDDRIDFCSNDYLGLSRSADLSKAIDERYSAQSFFNGSTGSRLLTGNSALAEQLERKLAEIFNAEDVLLFNSGYAANLGVLSSLPGKGDTVLYDELVHASIKDGMRLSISNRYPFAHNDLDQLEKKLKKSSGTKFIVVESIYSMNGDTCPLVELVTLSEKYNAAIILDEAHSTGIYGEKGNGLACQLRLEEKIAARIYTFGKAVGVHGACVAGSKQLKQFLINFSRPLIYSTMLAPHALVSIECAFDYLQHHPTLDENLHNRIDIFVEQMKRIGVEAISKTAIQPILTSGNDNAKRWAAFLQSKGFDVRAILSPTVPKGQERLRICLHAYNTEDEISSLANVLKDVIR